MLQELIKRIDNKLTDKYSVNYGREIIVQWCCDFVKNLDPAQEIRVLDIGLGCGTDLKNIKNNIPDQNMSLFGVECYGPNVQKANQEGFHVFQINIEKDTIPVADGFFDIIIANQLIEHVKELFWVFSEISRTLKKNGVLIVGVPNLASLQGRLLLFLGQQPVSMQLLGAHIRGITKPGFTNFIETDNYFKVIGFKGINFCYLTPKINKFLSFLFPTLTTSIFFKVQRMSKEGRFIEVLNTRFFETPYFNGNN